MHHILMPLDMFVEFERPLLPSEQMQLTIAIHLGNAVGICSCATTFHGRTWEAVEREYADHMAHLRSTQR